MLSVVCLKKLWKCTPKQMWDAAHKIAVTYMSEETMPLYLNQATKLDKEKPKYKEAEKLYITISEQDQAINMYKPDFTMICYVWLQLIIRIYCETLTFIWLSN